MTPFMRELARLSSFAETLCRDDGPSGREGRDLTFLCLRLAWHSVAYGRSGKKLSSTFSQSKFEADQLQILSRIRQVTEPPVRVSSVCPAEMAMRRYLLASRNAH